MAKKPFTHLERSGRRCISCGILLKKNVVTRKPAVLLCFKDFVDQSLPEKFRAYKRKMRKKANGNK